jgi:nitroreductase
MSALSFSAVGDRACFLYCVRRRSRAPTALAARVAAVRIGSCWTSTLYRSARADAARR